MGVLPNGLVGDDYLGPLLLGELLSGRVELTSDYIDGLVGLTLLVCIVNTVESST
jgi:hypothetical protein